MTRMFSASIVQSSLRRAFGLEPLLILPILIILAFGFVAPVALFMYRAVDNSDIPATLPRTVKALQDWNGEGLPADAAYQTLAADLKEAEANNTLGSLARRLNLQDPGMRRILLGTARSLPDQDPVGRDALIELNPAWGENEAWALLKQESGRFTLYYMLATLELQQKPGDGIVASPGQTPFVSIFLRTLWISASVTALCFLLGYPLAWGLASFSPRTSSILMIFVLIPFWMSLLVRTTGWIILLQNNGPVNDLLMWLGVIDSPLPLMFSRIGVVIAMTHVLLPYMILPVYSIMKGISPDYLRAAGSLGANPVRAFIHVYFPQSLPGVGAGCLLVAILALGYYITPALVGGPGDQMISYYIAFYTNQSINWGQAAALGTWLLACTLVLLMLLRKAVDFRRIKVR